MNKSKLAISIDSISITLLFFITILFFFRRYIKNAFLLFFICIFISLCLFILIFRYFIKKHNLQKITIKDSKHANICLQNIKLSSKETCNNFYKSLLNCTHINKNIYENEKFLYYINLRSSLSCYDFFTALDHHHTNNKKQLIFISIACDEEFKNLLETTADTFYYFSYSELYQLMKKTQIFPVDILPEKTISQKFKIKLNSFLSTITKHHFKDYFFSGLSLIMISFFVPYTVYYSIFGTFLLILSIICLFKSKNNNLPSKKNKISLTDTIKK